MLSFHKIRYLRKLANSVDEIWMKLKLNVIVALLRNTKKMPNSDLETLCF